MANWTLDRSALVLAPLPLMLLLSGCGARTGLEVGPNGPDVPDAAGETDAMGDTGLDSPSDSSAGDVDGPAFDSGPVLQTLWAGESSFIGAQNSAAFAVGWGENSSGQLDGTLTNAIVPRKLEVSGDSFGLGMHHSCFVRSGGISCWGNNESGQTSAETSAVVRSPSEVKIGGKRAAKVTAGLAHTCGLDVDATVWCWGSNSAGQRGDGGPDGPSPGMVKGLAAAIDIEAYRLHTCALGKDSSVVCWGSNSLGALADPIATNTGLVDVRLPNVWRLAHGSSANHTCVVDHRGGVYCWGDSQYGQTGHAPTSSDWRPELVHGLAAATDAAVGWRHTCVLDVDGRVSCFGAGTRGQCGPQGENAPAWTPKQVALPSRAVAMAAAANTTCAILDNGAAWCWGAGWDGALGNGDYSDSSVPTRVLLE